LLSRVRVLASSAVEERRQSVVFFFMNYSYNYVSYVASLVKANLGYRASEIRRLATFLVALARDTICLLIKFKNKN